MIKKHILRQLTYKNVPESCVFAVCAVCLVASAGWAAGSTLTGAGGSSKQAVQKKLDSKTIQAVNQIPGVKVSAQDMQNPELPPIHGFHPVKKMLRPVENLETMSLRLNQQIMRLFGPIAALQPPMLSLKDRMGHVEQTMAAMQNQIGSVKDQVGGAADQIKAVRNDIASMHQELAAVNRQVGGLKGPITNLVTPLSAVAQPLSGLDKRLFQVQCLIAGVLLAIVVSSVAIAIGTPIAAIFIYRNRRKIVPELKDNTENAALNKQSPAQ